MAYVPQPQDEEERRAAAAGGTELGSFGGTQGSIAPTQPKFVNVADYLSKNTEGSAQLGEAASKKLESQRDEAGSAVSDSGSRFTTDVTAGTTNLDQGVLDSALNDSTNFVKDPNNVAKFMAMRDASYKGPQSLQSTDYFSPTQSKVSGLGTTAAGLGTEEGRNALVHSLSDRPTQGKTALNQLLLQGNPAAAQKIQDTAGTFKSVEDQWAQILANAPAAADAARATTEATKATTGQRLGETTGAFKTGLQNKLATAENERNAFNLNYQNIGNSLANEGGTSLTQKQLDDMGISEAAPWLAKTEDMNDRLDSYYDGRVPLSQYTDPGRVASNLPTLGGVSNSDDYAREAALQQLSGNDLGLGDVQEPTYRMDGELQSIDYINALLASGGKLKPNEINLLRNPGSTGGVIDGVLQPSFYDARNSYATTREAYDANTGNVNDPGYYLPGTTTRTPYDASKDYYTTPTPGVEAQPNIPVAPPPPGWQSGTPPPYPEPTSNPPQNMIQPRWNPYEGKWEGAYSMPTNPPPSGGGGGGVFYGPRPGGM